MRSIQTFAVEQKMIREAVATGYGILKKAAIAEIDPDVFLPDNFDASAWLGLTSDRAPEFSERFWMQVVELEKGYVTARLVQIAGGLCRKSITMQPLTLKHVGSQGV